MGTDMWMLTEVSEDGETWRPLKSFTPRKTTRSYPLFALLADVRNHSGRHQPRWQEHGFLPDGTLITLPEPILYDTEEGGFDRIEPITEPRGIPDNASDLWKAFALEWLESEATVDTSWITPEEVLTGDFNQPLYGYGHMTEEEYKKYLEGGEPPKLFAEHIGGDGLLVVNEVEYAAGKRGEKDTAIRARWNQGVLRDYAIKFDELAATLAKTSSAGGLKVRFMLLFES